MPIWLRNLTFKNLEKYYEEQNSPSSSTTSTNNLNDVKDILQKAQQSNSVDLQANVKSKKT
jgi:hypothetical protein